MLKKKKLLLIVLIILILAGFIIYKTKKQDKIPGETVALNKGTITEKVIAVGSIIPKQSISVKSTISGIVGQLFYEEGDYVKQGDLLLKIIPSPTPQSIAEAYEAVKENKATLNEAASHHERIKKLLTLKLETADHFATSLKDVKTAEARLEWAEQKLALLQKGETTIAGQQIKTMVYSPINGYILERRVNEGDPVVPLTEAQEGTVLFVIADMRDLIFKGSVNEIDVAKITPGMIADISVAALPNTHIQGSLRKVDLQSIQASKDTNTLSSKTSPFNVGFNIELNKLILPKNIKLRAGYSATAEIIVKKADHVLTVPERFLIFKDKKTYVNLIHEKRKNIKLQEVKIGITDGINAEVVSGATFGDTVIQLPTKA